MTVEEIKKFIKGQNHPLSDEAIDLYVYLLQEAAKDDNRFISQKEMITIFPKHFRKAEKYMQGGSDMCRKLWDCVNEINRAIYIPQIVVVKNYNMKIANKEEAEKYEKAIHDTGIKKLVRAARINFKKQRADKLELVREDTLVIDDNEIIKIYAKDISEALKGGKK